MSFRGPVTTKHGTALVDGDRPPSARDLAEIEAFQRFLQIAPPTDAPERERVGWLPRCAAGWIPLRARAGPGAA